MMNETRTSAKGSVNLARSVPRIRQNSGIAQQDYSGTDEKRIETG
jgi:hypothetical protein